MTDDHPFLSARRCNGRQPEDADAQCQDCLPHACSLHRGVYQFHSRLAKNVLNAYHLLKQREAISYRDVREWIQKVDEMGELKVVENVDWNSEIGSLSALSENKSEKGPGPRYPGPARPSNRCRT